NGRIENKSSEDVKNLNLSLYFIKEDTDLEAGKFDGYLISDVSLGKIAKNSNLVGVNIRKSISEVPPVGKYKSILVLTDKKDNVLAYKITQSTVESDNESLSILKEKPQVPAVKSPDLYPKVMIDLKEDNAIAF